MKIHSKDNGNEMFDKRGQTYNKFKTYLTNMSREFKQEINNQKKIIQSLEKQLKEKGQIIV